MPDGYQNPNRKPPTGPLKWVPPGIPKGGEIPNGDAWDTLSIVRGKFRNDLPVTATYPNSSVTVSVDGKSVSGSKDDPILAAFRYIARPSSVRGPTPSEPFVMGAKDDGSFSYMVKLSQNSRLSAITLNYALTVDLTDPTLWPNLTDADAAKAKAYKAGGDVPSIDWSQYKFAKITTVDTAGNEKEWPANDAKGNPQELLVTGPQITGNTPVQRTVTARFGDATKVNTTDFPTLSGVKISQRVNINSLQLTVQKVMLFDAERVNIRAEQLPCALLEYAISLQFNYDPASGQAVVPTSGVTPNTHVKVFSPDFVSGSPGFAHSFNLRFLVVSQQISGIDPTGANNLYFVIFTGPSPGTRTVTYALTSQANSVFSGGRVVRLDNQPLQDGVKSLKLQKSANPGDTIPDPTSTWNNIDDSAYDIAKPPAIDFLGTDGPFVRDFLYLDKTAKFNDWYRTVQTLSDNSQFFSAPFKNDIYYEHSSLTMDDPSNAATLTSTQSITRRDLLKADQKISDAVPLVVFMDDGGDRYYASPVTINSGPWRLRLEASNPDPNAYVNDFIYARFWFVPEDYSFNYIEPHKYRDQTEFYFNVSPSGGSTFVRDTPTDLSQLMVFPPLPNGNSMLEAIRYVDSISGSGTTSENRFNLPSSFGGKRAKLVIGLYTMAALDAEGTRLKINQTDVRLPSFTIPLDNSYNAVETSIFQSLSGAFYPVRANYYDSANFAALNAPLTATRSLVGGGSDGAAGYVNYTKTFQAVKDQTQNAFSGLMTLGTDASQQVKVCLPFTSIPDKYDNTAFVVGDFVTNAATLAKGRVLNGDWEIEMALNGDADTASVACDFKFEIMLVNTTGKIAERIFRSPVVSGLTSKSDTIKFKTTINYPFMINGSDTQMIIRVWAFPYARKTPVNIDALKKQLGGVPLGARIDSLSINSHTVQRLSFVQTDSRPGSPAWYEDLQLTPNRSLEANEFWFVVASDLQNVQTVTGGVGLNITGTLYGPAWYIDLPSDIEVEMKTGAFQNVNFWVRTVLGKSGTTESGVSAIEDHRSGEVHVAHDEPAPSGSIQHDTGRQIRHFAFHSPYQKPTVNTVVKGMNGKTATTMEGRDPSLFIVRKNESNIHKNYVGVIAHVDETSGSSFNIALNPHGQANTWIGPNHTLSDKTFGALRKIASGLEKPNIAISDNGLLAYITGIVPNSGALLMKEVNPYNAGPDSNTAYGTNYLVEGDSTIPLSYAETVIQPKGVLNGKVNETFASVAVTKHGQIAVAYSLEGSSGTIHMRFRFSGQSFGPAIPVVNLSKMGLVASSDLNCYAPALALHESSNTIYLAFWMGGKILMTKVQGYNNTNQGVILAPIHFVAGSRDFTKSSVVNAALQTLQGSKQLIVSTAGTIENDVPQQRIGIYVSDRAPYQGDVFIYYLNSDNKLCMRHVRTDAFVGSPIIVE